MQAAAYNGARTVYSGMSQAGRQGGGRTPLQILADQKAPPGSGGAPYYYSPPRLLDFATCPNYYFFNLYEFFVFSANLNTK